jgi:transposase InsO family protein
VAYDRRLGVIIQRLLNDNGSAFHRRALASVCCGLGIKYRFTRRYSPQTNGKPISRLKLDEYNRLTTHS